MIMIRFMAMCAVTIAVTGVRAASAQWFVEPDPILHAAALHLLSSSDGDGVARRHAALDPRPLAVEWFRHQDSLVATLTRRPGYGADRGAIRLQRIVGSAAVRLARTEDVFSCDSAQSRCSFLAVRQIALSEPVFDGGQAKIFARILTAAAADHREPVFGSWGILTLRPTDKGWIVTDWKVTGNS